MKCPPVVAVKSRLGEKLASALETVAGEGYNGNRERCQRLFKMLVPQGIMPMLGSVLMSTRPALTGNFIMASNNF